MSHVLAVRSTLPDSWPGQESSGNMISLSKASNKLALAGVPYELAGLGQACKCKLVAGL